MEYTRSPSASSSSPGRENDRRSWSHDHDELTGLPNKALFSAAVDAVIRRSDVSSTCLVVVSARLDCGRLSSIGLSERDEALKAAGKRIASAVRPGDICARTAPLVFSALMPARSKDDAPELAERAAKAFAGFAVACDDEEGRGARVGAAWWPDHGNDASELLDAAGIAMRACQTGRSFALYSKAMGDDGDAELGAALGSAIGRGALGIHYQPVVRISDGAIDGVEALARWNDPERGEMEPSRFIPIAERSGLIVGLDEGVLRAACGKGGAWAAREGDSLDMSVNLSPLHLARREFPDSLRGILREAAMPPERLCVEVTEAAVLKSPEETADGLRKLKAVGVSLSVDDFGAGLSKPSMLKTLPIDAVKIDGAYIAGMESSHTSLEVIGGMIGLAHRMGIKVIAEGVETPGQFYLLRSLGCDLIQGFLFSEAVPADELERRYLFRGGATRGSPFAFRL